MGILDSLSKPENAAAVWSAVAATCSAIAAYLSWRAQMLTLRHTFRPELHFSGWHRVQRVNPEADLLVFTQITNVGRDTARHVVVNSFALADDQRPLYGMGTVNVPSLVPSEAANVNAEITIHWKNVPKTMRDKKLLQVQVRAVCWDALEVRHETTLSLLLTEGLEAPVGNTAKVASGAYLSHQVTRSVSVWRLKVRRSARRIPVLGRAFSDDA